ncbi:hypothetical protein G3567_09880 [Psychroflexus sp. YR1-1]|uniref:Uncharacterized protein n=1 Tax=Psychroflexus aurantiacus TaxID=2709310 RepID=A0A6B3R4H4_9FLAO|nr:hypothetical protein [Psychroflexus aurantiacus]NEV94450.1 hypothetical protein [Psychroflexus aurantiacus]
MKKILLILSLIFTMSTYAQTEQKNSCTPEHTFAKFKVELFLTKNEKSYREKTGTIEESVDKISAVKNESECIALNNFIEKNDKYHQINQGIDTSLKTIYYYKTSNFYYIFWGFKPEYYRPRMGPKQVFIVVNKDLSQHWEFYK